MKNNKLIKLRNIIEDCFYNGKLTKYHLSLSDVHYLAFAYNGLARDGKYITFKSNVAKICRKCGFTVINPHDDEINYCISVD